MLTTRATLAAVALWWFGCGDNSDEASSEKPLVSALFIGNSLTYVNDVPARWEAALADHFTPESQVVAIGGYRLDQHAQDAATPGTDLARLLGVDAPTDLHYDYVFMQEQSATAGDASDAAATAGTLALARLAQAHGAQVVLYETWGYKSLAIGFEPMQDAIDARFQDLAAYLREQDIDTALAPAGIAYRLIYEELIAEGTSPTTTGSDFDLLYEDDRHPTVRGAYLAACVLAGASADEHVGDFPDEPTLGPDVSLHLRDVCKRALHAPRIHVPTRLRPADTIYTQGSLQSCGPRSLAASAAGDRIAVTFDSSPTDTDVHTSVYRRDSSGWTLEASFASGPDVVMNEAGDVLLTGPPTRIYRRTANVWTEDSGYPASSFWSAWTDVALSGDGQSLFVTGSDAMVGKVVQFVWQSSTWTENILFEHPIGLIATDRSGGTALLGSNSMFLDQPQTGESGFVRNNLGITAVPGPIWYFAPWAHPTATHVALSPDGTIAASVDYYNHEAVFVTRDEQSTGILMPSGDALAVSEHGETILVGDPMAAPVEDGWLDGAVHVFREHEGQYQYDLELLAPPYTESRTLLDGSCVGTTVAMSADMTHVFVHAPNQKLDGSTVGAVYEFVLPPPN